MMICMDDLIAIAEKLRTISPLSRGEMRRRLLAGLDEKLSLPESENSPVLTVFYHRQCRRICEEVRSWKGPGVRVWKLYSSGLLVKDSEGRVSGFDISDGVSPTDLRRARLQLSEELIEELTDLTDVMYYTHAHLDHIGLRVAEALLKKHKTVIAPRAAIRGWLLEGALEAENYSNPRAAVVLSRQGTGPNSVPNAVFAVTFPPGLTLMVKGDVFQEEDFLEVLDQFDRKHIRIDVAAISAYFKGGLSPVAELYARHRCGFIAVHEWEFSHRPLGQAGKATQTYADFYDYFPENMQCARMAWGESVNLTEFSHG